MSSEKEKNRRIDLCASVVCGALGGGGLGLFVWFQGVEILAHFPILLTLGIFVIGGALVGGITAFLKDRV